MSARDFPPRAGDIATDPHSLEQWLDKLGLRQNIDLLNAITPAGGDKLALFDISGTVLGSITLDNLFGAAMPVTGTWTPAPTGLTVVGTPTYTGTYTRIGKLVYVQMEIASTVSTASTAGATFFSGLPFTCNKKATVHACDTGAIGKGDGLIFSGGTDLYTPTWGANADVIVDGMYQTA